MKKNKARGPVQTPTARPTRERVRVLQANGKLRLAWRPIQPK